MSSPTYWLLQHELETPPGTLLEWLKERGKNVRSLYMPDTNGQLPTLNHGDKLLVLGGSMNTDEEGLYPWMTAEKELIRKAAESGTPYLGICLGAQLFCEAIGGRVQRMQEWEIGWWPVTEVAGTQVPAFHWHRYECVVPAGAEVLASSVTCPVQVYSRGPKQLCFQFHPEVDLDWINLAIGPTGTTGLEGAVQTPEQMRAGVDPNQAELKAWFFAQLDSWDKAWD